LHPLLQTARDFRKTKKKFKKKNRKSLERKKKGITFAAPKNETGIDSKASDDRSEEKERKDTRRVKA